MIDRDDEPASGQQDTSNPFERAHPVLQTVEKQRGDYIVERVIAERVIGARKRLTKVGSEGLGLVAKPFPGQTDHRWSFVESMRQTGLIFGRPCLGKAVVAGVLQHLRFTPGLEMRARIFMTPAV